MLDHLKIAGEYHVEMGWPPSISRDSIRKILVAALSVTPQVASQIIAAFTYKPYMIPRPIVDSAIDPRGKDGSWDKPLIPVGEDSFQLSLPALTSMNPHRLFDLLLRMKRVDGNLAGRTFERIARKRIYKAATESPFSGVFRARPEKLYLPTRSQDTDIDVMFIVGRTLYIADCKRRETIGTASEHFWGLNSLREGVDQLIRRTDACYSHIDCVLKFFNLP